MKNIKKYRIIIQAISLILTVLGFFINFKLTSFIFLIFTLFGGAFFCGFICPFGFLQDIFGLIGNLFKIKKRSMPKSIQRTLVYTRYLILILTVLLSLDFIFTILSYDPRANFENILLGNMVNIGVILVISLFLIVSLFFERPFCNYFCIEGAKYGLLSIFRVFTIKRESDLCINCNKCTKSCPMNIDVASKDILHSPQCINCFECISSCPVEGALKYKTIKLKPIYFIIRLALIAIIIFSVYAIDNTNILENISNSNEKNTEYAVENSIKVDKSNTHINDAIDNTINKRNRNGHNNMNNESASNEDKIKENNNPISDEEVKIGTATDKPDGIYTGIGKGFRGDITVEITIENGSITNIEVTDTVDDAKWFNRAYSYIPPKIISAQTTDVDTVSGASYSSRGIIEGVKDALSE